MPVRWWEKSTSAKRVRINWNDRSDLNQENKCFEMTMRNQKAPLRKVVTLLINMWNNLFVALNWLRTDQETKSQKKIKRNEARKPSKNKNRKRYTILPHYVLTRQN